MEKELSGVFELPDVKTFLETQYVKNIIERALTYIKAGFPVHLSGPSGTGKTSIAMHIGKLLGQPIILIHGDDEFSSSDLVGGNFGFKKRRVLDNYVHSVSRLEERWEKQWSDGRITKACREGMTLIYDEFTRSRPEAHNELLSVLEEKILDLPKYYQGKQYIRVHPDFSAIFTSNPEEYVGVYKTQDALMDRMITIELEPYDLETEIDITVIKSGLIREDAIKIVNLVRGVRDLVQNRYSPSIRSCIMIAKITKMVNGQVHKKDPIFCQTCFDILLAQIGNLLKQTAENGQPKIIIENLIEEKC